MHCALRNTTFTFVIPVILSDGFLLRACCATVLTHSFLPHSLGSIHRSSTSLVSPVLKLSFWAVFILTIVYMQFPPKSVCSFAVLFPLALSLPCKSVSQEKSHPFTVHWFMAVGLRGQTWANNNLFQLTPLKLHLICFFRQSNILKCRHTPCKWKQDKWSLVDIPTLSLFCSGLVLGAVGLGEGVPQKQMKEKVIQRWKWCPAISLLVPLLWQHDWCVWEHWHDGVCLPCPLLWRILRP